MFMFCYFTDLVIAEATKLKEKIGSESHPTKEQEVMEVDTEEEQTPPSFFTSYRRKKKTVTSPQACTVRQQLTQYLASAVEEEVNPLKFWSEHAEQLPDLCRLARKVLIVPATSAPVERLFSHGGIVTRPHRAGIGEGTLADIVYLKTNRLR